MVPLSVNCWTFALSAVEAFWTASSLPLLTLTIWNTGAAHTSNSDRPHNVAHYVPDLMTERTLVAVNRYYYQWVLLGLLIPAAIGGLVTESLWGAITGFLWGGVVRMFVVEQSMSAINSLMHIFGARPYRTRDDNSRNLGVMAWLTWGEGWHNNRRAFPYSAAFGLRWFEFDPGYIFIRLLAASRLALNVKVPSPEKIALRRIMSPRSRRPISSVAIFRDSPEPWRNWIMSGIAGLMLFNSYPFLLGFLPVAILLCRLADPYPQMRIWMLVLLSLAFYASAVRRSSCCWCFRS